MSDTFANCPGVLQYPAIGTNSLISFTLVASLMSVLLASIRYETKTDQREKIWQSSNLNDEKKTSIYNSYSFWGRASTVQTLTRGASVMQRKLLHNLISFEYSNANKTHWLSRSSTTMGVSRQPTKKKKKAKCFSICYLVSVDGVDVRTCDPNAQSKVSWKKNEMKRKPFWIMAEVISAGAMQ